MRILHSKKLVFISKPRCGSTSVRNFLTKQAVKGDVICNTVDEESGLHPHMSSSSIKNYLRINGYDPDIYKYFTVTRNPLDMLWSYFKYFKPDINNKYNYGVGYDVENLLEFPEWLETGKVGIGKYWSKFVPPNVTAKNFSPLSLEAHICNIDGEIDVDKWFYLEQIGEVEDWLTNFFDSGVSISTVNGSDTRERPKINKEILEKLRPQFPIEAKYYNF
jgi:hypothetical protein